MGNSALLTLRPVPLYQHQPWINRKKKTFRSWHLEIGWSSIFFIPFHDLGTFPFFHCISFISNVFSLSPGLSRDFPPLLSHDANPKVSSVSSSFFQIVNTSGSPQELTWNSRRVLGLPSIHDMPMRTHGPICLSWMLHSAFRRESTMTISSFLFLFFCMKSALGICICDFLPICTQTVGSRIKRI